jgi:pheganomycin biosynthesis PGM1-like protein/ATP-grasp domain-containing protein
MGSEALPPEAARFEEIQHTLVPLWRSLESLNTDEQTIVVVPSLSLEIPAELAPVLPAYEERYLFLLFLLRQPRAHMVFVTSRPVSPTIVDYYLALLPGVIPSHARARLHLVSADDTSPIPLTRKLLDRSSLIERISSLVPDPARAHMIPFITTELERELVVRLGIPMYGADPRFTTFGTKSGSRLLFAEVGVPHPLGFEDLKDLGDVASAIEEIRAHKPEVERAIVKVNEGVSGMGNAVVDLRGLAASASRSEIEERLRSMHLPGGTYDEFADAFARQGGVVEERIEGEIRSPSVQLRGTPLGRLEILSTHDQLLGGPEGQTYEGCSFPAESAYARAITREASKVGERLVRQGVIGRFAIDFVVVRTPEGWDPYAIELNLRKGGTTHPYLTLQFLTDGRYDENAALFISPNGVPKYFIASDHVYSPSYLGLTVDELFDIVVRNGLHFDHTLQTGIVLHMMSALTEHGRFGLTAVANSHSEAEALYGRARAVLDEETARP